MLGLLLVRSPETFPLVFPLLFASSSLSCLLRPTLNTTIPDLVGEKDRVAANGLVGQVEAAAHILGPAIAAGFVMIHDLHLALVMTAALGPSLSNTIIAIAIPLVPSVARVIRANTLMLRELPFVEASRAVGMNEFAIAIRHVLPNTLAPLIVLATAQLGSTILVEAALSFLGLGVPEPHPSWGRMLSESAAEYVRTAPWLVLFPGVAISLIVFGTNLLGDALRDLLDPRQRS